MSERNQYIIAEFDIIAAAIDDIIADSMEVKNFTVMALRMAK